MIDKKWIITGEPDEAFLKRFADHHPLVAKLLYNRGVKEPNEAEVFFQPDYKQLADPFLFKDMGKAVDRILAAIGKKEKIVIHGDYDADGVTSSSILFTTLKALGAEVSVFLPHREEDGYGINKKNISQFIGEYDLLITVDCGITNIDELAMLKSGGLDAIVTDHHEPLEVLPDAVAVINPKVKDETYPFKYLCGAGVAYKLAVALLQKAAVDESVFVRYGGAEGFAKWLLDLAAIGTVADIMPLVGENRIIVKYGLKVLAQTKRLGLKALAEVAGLDLTREETYAIAFQIAPRLNAAGRLHHADLAFQLLVTEEKETARLLAAELNSVNTGRQKVTDSSMNRVREQLEAQEGQKMLFVYDKDIPSGIVGLIAGRISDEYYRPVMVMTMVGEQIVGSGRSIEQFDITKALFQASEFLSRYGGHPQACGFTLNSPEVLEKFKHVLLEAAQGSIIDDDLVPIVEIDAMAQPGELTLGLVKEIDKFAPFGEGNIKPKFWIKNLQITAMDKLGNGEKHLRLMAKAEDSYVALKFMGFGMVDRFKDLIAVGDKIDLVAEIGINVWNGNESVESRIVDIKKVSKRVSF